MIWRGGQIQQSFGGWCIFPFEQDKTPDIHCHILRFGIWTPKTYRSNTFSNKEIIPKNKISIKNWMGPNPNGPREK